MKEAHIKFCEESSIDLQPLAIMRICMKGKVSNWTKNLHVKATLEMEATYYNDKISNWEPLIEQIMVREDEYRPWSINLWFAIEEGGVLQPPLSNGKGVEFLDFPVKDLDYSMINEREKPVIESAIPRSIEEEEEEEEEEEGEEEKDIEQKTSLGKASYINIESNDSLNLNLTPSAYKVMMYLAKITTSSEEKDLLEGTVKHPFKFFNFLGKKATLIVPPKASIVKPEFLIGFEFEEKSLNSSDLSTRYHSTESLDQGNVHLDAILKARSEKQQATMLNSILAEADASLDKKYKFSLDIEEFERVELSLKTDGSYLIQLREKTDKEGEGEADDELQEASRKKTAEMIRYTAMFRIKTNYGRKKVIFR